MLARGETASCEAAGPAPEQPPLPARPSPQFPEQDARGVDLSLIRENLELSPVERIRRGERGRQQELTPLLERLGHSETPSWADRDLELNKRSAPELEAIGTVVYLLRLHHAGEELKQAFDRVKPNLATYFERALDEANRHDRVAV
jgi:hypothetical protein